MLVLFILLIVMTYYLIRSIISCIKSKEFPKPSNKYVKRFLYSLLLFFGCMIAYYTTIPEEFKEQVQAERMEKEKAEKAERAKQIEEDKKEKQEAIEHQKEKAAKEKARKLAEEEEKAKHPLQYLLEFGGAPRVGDNWKDAKNFYSDKKLDESYVYIEGESPNNIRDTAVITYLRDSRSNKVKDIYIQLSQINGGLWLKEVSWIIKRYLPYDMNSYMLVFENQNILVPNSGTGDYIYRLNYTKNYKDSEGYSVIIHENDGCIASIEISDSLFLSYNSRTMRDYTMKQMSKEDISLFGTPK